ncbi:MAG: chorismate mutase [Alphaproteobacteria bacterium]|nr:chorismate mutase [Alphaproteobacteria bacterium]
MDKPVERILQAARCQTMTDIREQIDRLDRALVAMVAERQSYIERAAEIKKDRNVVRDEARIADVLTKVTAEARRHGLQESIARDTWIAMMEACIAHEFVCFDAIAQRPK